MHTIVYQALTPRDMEQVCTVYRANGWSNYLGDTARLARAFAQSLYVMGAFHDGKLVGFVRCVGDGEYILYVQDLIVLPAYHRRGIGTALMHRTFARYPDVRQLVLVTDENDPVSNGFYTALGMSRDCNGYPVTHYFRVFAS